MQFIGIIPARYGSSRFPGKPLADIHGKPMIHRVYEQVSKAIDRVYVATDDSRIEQTVNEFGGKAILTGECKTGTDRCAKAARIVVVDHLPENSYDNIVIINIQGDEPYIKPEQIKSLMSCFHDPSVQIATLVKAFDKTEDFLNENRVKVVFDTNKNALYFSRSVVPFVAKTEQNQWINKHTFYKHIGIYAYKFAVLQEITSLEQSSLELAESLEQNRWLENGYKIKVEYTDFESLAVDTEEDLQFIRDKK